MQKDPQTLSTPGRMMQNQAGTEESPVKALQCSHCTLIFKSKVYLFEHLNKVHGFDVDTALRDAGLKHSGIMKVKPGNNSNSGRVFLCQHCDFKSCQWDVLNDHERQCPKNSEKGTESANISENPENKIIVTSAKQHMESAGTKEISPLFSVLSTSKTKSALISSKDLKTYKKTITKYFMVSPGSNEEPTGNLSDSPVLPNSTVGTLILQESPSNSSGVFKVTAKSMIDIHSNVSQQFLLNDQLLMTDMRSQRPKEESKETVPKKRTNNESSEDPPAKKAKSCQDTKPPESRTTGTEQSPSKEFSFEISEDEERIDLVNGDAESQNVYFCKHCDYSEVNIRHVSNHYQNNHPYVRYNSVYIQDPSDQSATFRCLECPVEFSTVPELKRHNMQNHPKAPDLFTMQACELGLVFKCFVCRFTSNVLKALKEHYKEKHPTHKVDNTLLFCRYSVTRCQEASSQLNTCKRASNPEGSERNSPESARTSCREVKNALSPQHVALYHCSNCNFSHKSVVVMQVHYQKSHPDKPITIDKIKQSHTPSQMTPEKSPNSVTSLENCRPQSNTSESSKDKPELSQQEVPSSLNLKQTPEASLTHSKSPKPKNVESTEDRSKARKSLTKHDREVSTSADSSTDRMFYCMFCSYSSTNIRSVIGHHNAKHTLNGPTSTEELLCYSAKLQKKKPQSEPKAATSTHSNKVLQYDKDVASASVKEVNSYECAENLFYCQKCNFGNPSLKGVLNHQSKVHRRINSSSDCILKHTAKIHEEIKKSKSHTKESPFSTHLPLPLMNEGDEDMFFCHFCNYRHGTMERVLKHYFKSHRGFEVQAERVRLHTSLVLEQTRKLHVKSAEDDYCNDATLENKQGKKKKTKMLTKCYSASVSSSKKASQTQRTLKCHRCTYATQYLYLLRRHMRKIHRSNRTSSELLRVYFKRGHLESGYHCELCVFSHNCATTVHKHYQEQHPERKQSLEYISTRLYVGPDKPPLKRGKTQIQHTDGILPSKGSVDSKTKAYSCKACSFKGSSLSGMTRHYRAVHPWSVKEDGSVLGVRINKKRSANSQSKVDETLESFDAYQIPIEFDKSEDLSPEPKESDKEFTCSFCPASFYTQHSLKTHCGMKHQGAAKKNSEQQEKQQQTRTRVHVFRCPHCSYINSNYQGVLTHCQMKHPSLTSRADSLHVDKAHLKCLDDSLKRSSPGNSLRYRGYICKTCQKIYSTVEKLNSHYEKYHDPTVKPVSKPSAASKIQQSGDHGSVSKASFLCKKIYAVVKCQYCQYSCSTKIALSRHLSVHHMDPSVSKVKDSAYSCVLCSQFYFRKKHLGSHYIKKHGKDAFFKHYVPVYKQVSQKSAPTSPDHPLTQDTESTSEQSRSTTTTADDNKILVYKCPACPYVNASYHGTLTHCQMIHPDLVVRADKLETTEILVTNMVRCTMGKGSNERGYMCNRCPQIHASLAKLKMHNERSHDQVEPVASDQSDEIEEQPDHDPMGYAFEADSLKSKTQAENTTKWLESSPETVKNKEAFYKCHICTYTGSCRKYLYCHYKNTHKLDTLSMFKLLEKYNKRNRKFHKQTGAESEESAHKCKKCPNLTFESSKLLIAHYSSFYSKYDFTVLSQRSTRSTGSYKCSHCKKLIHGIKNLCYHLDRHRARRMRRADPAEMQASFVITAQEAKTSEPCRQDDLPLLENVEELARWNVTPVETFILPASPVPSPSKPTDSEQPEMESKGDKHSCKQCRRTFRSLKGLRSHERSHAALAAIKKLDNLPPSALKHNINRYVLYKSGTFRPFLCSFCSYRTTVLGLMKSHFMKNHQDVIAEAVETDNQEEKSATSADKDPPHLTEEMNGLPEPVEEPEMSEKSLYLEPPDVQRQLNQYTLMAQIGVSSKANLQEAMLPENSLLHCEFCNFNTGHLSSMRRHYLNRHGKKILRCKDCDFFTGVRKTLEMHMETGHTSFQSEPTHQKDLRCPFCLYQTKNKNNMIDHIILHREERLVPIEVRRSKLSRYLQGIVFRCHKCTFSSGSAENLRLHMMKHNDIKPYKCRLCYFDCTRLSDLEAHLSDKHQVVRNHELVGQVSLDQQEAAEDESLSNSEQHNNDCGDVESEEFDTDCNDVLSETLAKKPTKSYRRGKKTLNITEADQNHDQDPQEQAGFMLLPNAASGQGIKNDGNGKNADIQLKDSSGKNEVMQKENQAQPKQTDSEDGSMKFIPPKQEATEWSLTEYGEQDAEVHTPHFKAPQHRISNIKSLVEDDPQRHVLVPDEEGCQKGSQDRTVKMEQNSKTEAIHYVLSEKRLLDEEGNISAHSSRSTVDMKAIPALTTKKPANYIIVQESLKVEKQMTSCAQLKISHKENFGVSFANFKEEVHSQKHSKEVTDSYREIPVLDNVLLKEEMYPLKCCKEEEESDEFEEKQCREDASTVGAAEVLCPSVTEKKLYTCEFCGRNLMNSHELTRHVMRHGI